MIGVGLWAAIASCAVLLELLARRTGRWSTLGELGRRLASPRLGALCLLVFWAFAGWHLFSRYTIHPV